MFSTSSDGSNAVVGILDHDSGTTMGSIVKDITSTQFTVQFANGGVYESLNSSGAVIRTGLASGYFRVLATRIK